MTPEPEKLNTARCFSKHLTGILSIPLSGVLLLTLLTCCAPIEIDADYFQKGFDYTNIGYTALPGGERFDKTITIRNLKFVIVGDETAIRPPKSIPLHDGIAQPVEPVYEMWVIGKQLKGKIIINRVVLGYELRQLVHLADPEVMNPRDMEAVEACIAVYPHDICGKAKPLIPIAACTRRTSYERHKTDDPTCFPEMDSLGMVCYHSGHYRRRMRHETCFNGLS